MVRISKTDLFCQGSSVILTPSADDTLCAVTALDHLLAASTCRPGPAFQSKDGVPLTRPRLNTLIRELVFRMGQHPEHYSPHSFRIRATSTAVAAGIPDWRIQALSNGPVTATGATFTFRMRTPHRLPQLLQRVHSELVRHKTYWTLANLGRP